MSELSLEFGYSYIEVQHILGKMSVCKLWWENCLFAEMGWGIHYSTGPTLSESYWSLTV